MVEQTTERNGHAVALRSLDDRSKNLMASMF